MAAYGANQYTSTGNPLCDKLKRQFADRGAAAVKKYSAPSTSAMIDRVQKGLNPYENAPDPTREKRTATGTVRAADMQRRQVSGAYRENASKGQARPVQSTAAHTKPKASVSAPQKKAAAPKTAPRAVAASSAFSTESMRRRSAAAAAQAVKAKTPMTEVRVARAPFPFAALMMLTIFTIMIMVIVLSFAQNYELSNEIDVLSAQQKALSQREQELTLRLEEREDIRVIEDIALNEIGMVKSDLVESRFVTVSSGNRVELSLSEEPENVPQSGVFGNLLSAMGENFAKLREYID